MERQCSTLCLSVNTCSICPIFPPSTISPSFEAKWRCVCVLPFDETHGTCCSCCQQNGVERSDMQLLPSGCVLWFSRGRDDVAVFTPRCLVSHDTCLFLPRSLHPSLSLSLFFVYTHMETHTQVRLFELYGMAQLIVNKWDALPLPVPLPFLSLTIEVI